VSWQALVSVALGGAFGTLARVSVDGVLEPQDHLSTALVNITGALILGFVMGHGLPRAAPWLRDGLTVGVLGSFTTMSGIALLALSSPWWSAVVTVTSHFVLGILAAWWGYRIGRSRQEVTG
jgi:CrcB protein